MAAVFVGINESGHEGEGQGKGEGLKGTVIIAA